MKVFPWMDINEQPISTIDVYPRSHIIYNKSNVSEEREYDPNNDNNSINSNCELIEMNQRFDIL
jgi:hypothetical protein